MTLQRQSAFWTSSTNRSWRRHRRRSRLDRALLIITQLILPLIKQRLSMPAEAVTRLLRSKAQTDSCVEYHTLQQKSAEHHQASTPSPSNSNIGRILALKSASKAYRTLIVARFATQVDLNRVELPAQAFWWDDHPTLYRPLCKTLSRVDSSIQHLTGLSMATKRETWK